MSDSRSRAFSFLRVAFRQDEAEFRNFLSQRISVDPKKRGRSNLIAVRVLEHGRDKRLLDVGKELGNGVRPDRPCQALTRLVS